MELHGQLAVRLLDVVGAGALLHTERGVIVFFGHCRGPRGAWLSPGGSAGGAGLTVGRTGRRGAIIFPFSSSPPCRLFLSPRSRRPFRSRFPGPPPRSRRRRPWTSD